MGKRSAVPRAKCEWCLQEMFAYRSGPDNDWEHHCVKHGWQKGLLICGSNSSSLGTTHGSAPITIERRSGFISSLFRSLVWLLKGRVND